MIQTIQLLQRWYESIRFKFLKKFFFLLATVAMITVKFPFLFFDGNHCYERNSFMKIIQLINPNYLWRNGVKDKVPSGKIVINLYFLWPIVIRKTTATGSNRFFKNIFTNITHITKWMLNILKNVLFFFKISLMASLNILRSDLHNFLKEVTQKKKKKKKDERST